jgi:hypothetical protein
MGKFSTSPQDARDMGLYGRAAALCWAARWGWSVGLVMDGVGTLSGRSRGLSKSLVDAGLLQAHTWEHSTHVKFRYSITGKGLDWLEENSDEVNEIADRFGYPQQLPAPKKIPKFQNGIAVHNLFVQLLGAIHLIEEKRGRATGYKTPFEMAGMRKIPDCLIERKGGKTDHIEFEYSKKNSAEIQNFLVNYHSMLIHDENSFANIYFSSRNLMRPFEKLWHVGSILASYNRNAHGQWIPEIIGTELIDGPHINHLVFIPVSWVYLTSRLAELPKMRPKLAPPPKVVDLW